jgi:hypothetical protein
MRTGKANLSMLRDQDQFKPEHELMAALRAVQDDARRAGLNKLTERQIDAEVTASRRQQGKKIKQPAR